MKATKSTKFKVLASAGGLAMAMAMASAPASAAVKYAFQDDDLDFLYRPITTNGVTTLNLIDPQNCNGSGDANCQFVTGDVLVSVFEFPTFTIDGVNAIPAGQQLTGIAAIQYYGDVTVPVLGLQRQYTAYSGGLDAILALGDGADPTVTGGAAGESAIVAMWLNSAATLDSATEDRNLELDVANILATNCTSAADCIDEASKGTLLQVDGGIFPDLSTQDPDNAWLSGTAGADIYDVWKESENTIIVPVNGRLSTLWPALNILPQDNTGNPNPACTRDAADGCWDFKVTASVNGGNGLSNGAFAHSTSIAASKFVPEPGSLALTGLGLLGLAFGRRRWS